VQFSRYASGQKDRQKKQSKQTDRQTYSSQYLRYWNIRYRAQGDVVDDLEGGISATNDALDLCVSEPHSGRRKAIGDAGVNSVVITYVTALTSDHYVLYSKIKTANMNVKKANSICNVVQAKAL